mmetsp:Transcript_21544/g.37876  ORF Transcript_21544/g.37876 Transcript_21544/m.37876 type:complete len:204 (-) Transcript_21544:61-672(-)
MMNNELPPERRFIFHPTVNQPKLNNQAQSKSTLSNTAEKDQGDTSNNFWSSERRFIFHPANNQSKPNNQAQSKPKPSNVDFCGMSMEDALKEQERLLKAAAARVRTNPSFYVTSQPIPSKQNSAYLRTFTVHIPDVHKRFPDHWQYKDLYARLGLPRNATESMIKKSYRLLAKVYHPDRNISSAGTKHKFQAVTEAYSGLMHR